MLYHFIFLNLLPTNLQKIVYGILGPVGLHVLVRQKSQQDKEIIMLEKDLEENRVMANRKTKRIVQNAVS